MFSLFTGYAIFMVHLAEYEKRRFNRIGRVTIDRVIGCK
jgi:hypothetical protein